MSSFLDFSGVRLTRHARQVMKARKIELDDVLAVVNKPGIVEPHEGAWRFVRGDLCAVVVVDRGAALVITVLLRRGEQWTDEDAKGRSR